MMPSNGNGGFGGKEERLLLTNGTPTSRFDSFSNSMVSDYGLKNCDDGYWGKDVEEEIKWDSMFQNLKPT